MFYTEKKVSEFMNETDKTLIVWNNLSAGEALDIYQIMEITKGSLEKGRKQDGARTRS